MRPGPRVYGTGYLMEWSRVYYKMGIAISSVSQFEMELQRAKVLAARSDQELRAPARSAAEADGGVRAQHRRAGRDARDLSRRRSSASTTPSTPRATSRRGYSPKMATLQRSYEDVVQLFGKSAAHLLPDDLGRRRARAVRERSGAARTTRASSCIPQWIQRAGRGAAGGGATPAAAAIRRGGSGKMVLDIMKAGGLVVAGTDTPNAINLHGELMAYTMAGMTRVRCAEGGDREPGEGARPRRRHDRGRQARRPDRRSTATRSRTSRTRTRCGA